MGVKCGTSNSLILRNLLHTGLIRSQKPMSQPGSDSLSGSHVSKCVSGGMHCSSAAANDGDQNLWLSAGIVMESKKSYLISHLKIESWQSEPENSEFPGLLAILLGIIYITYTYTIHLSYAYTIS